MTRLSQTERAARFNQVVSRLHFMEGKRLHERPRAAELCPCFLPRRHGPVVRLHDVCLPNSASEIGAPPRATVVFRSAFIEIDHKWPRAQRAAPLDPFDSDGVVLGGILQPAARSGLTGLNRSQVDYLAVYVVVLWPIDIVNRKRMIVGIDFTEAPGQCESFRKRVVLVEFFAHVEHDSRQIAKAGHDFTVVSVMVVAAKGAVVFEHQVRDHAARLHVFQ